MKLILSEDIVEPVDGVETGLADVVIASINKKWDSIRDLNSIIVTMKDKGYIDYISIIEDILEDENNHIGKLQHIVEELSPVTNNIEDGKQEAEELI